MIMKAPSRTLILALVGGILFDTVQADMVFGTPAVPWVTRDRSCPTINTTWVHPDDGDSLDMKFYCLDDPLPLSNRQRCYFMYVPTCATTDSPLVLNFHGRASCPEPDETFMRWGTLAKTECFVTVYPWGNTDFTSFETSCWQQNGNLKLDLLDRIELGLPLQPAAPTCCCAKRSFGIPFGFPVSEFKTKDDEFTRAVIKDAVSKVATDSDATIDTKRIYLTGISNGAVFALGFAMENSDLIAGVGVHSGWLNVRPEKFFYQPIPIYMIHGQLDPLFAYDGVTLQGVPLWRSLGKVKELQYLGNKNNCDGTVVTDSTTWGDEAKLETRTNCDNGADVNLFTVLRTGHYPMLGVNADDGVSPENILEETTIDTTHLAWDFLKGQSKNEAPNLDGKSKSKLFVWDPFLLIFQFLNLLLSFIEDGFAFVGGLLGG